MRGPRPVLSRSQACCSIPGWDERNWGSISMLFSSRIQELCSYLESNCSLIELMIRACSELRLESNSHFDAFLPDSRG